MKHLGGGRVVSGKRTWHVTAKALCLGLRYGAMLTGLMMLPVAQADPFSAPFSGLTAATVQAATVQAATVQTATVQPATATLPLTHAQYSAQLMWWTEPAQYWVTVQRRSLAQATYDLFIFKTAEPQTHSDGAELVYQELDIGHVVALYHTGHDRGALAVVSRDGEGGYRFRGYHHQPMTHGNSQTNNQPNSNSSAVENSAVVNSAVVKGMDISSVTFPEYLNNTKLENGGAGWIFSFYGVNGQLLSDNTSFDVRTQAFHGSGPLRRPELEKFKRPFSLRFVGMDRISM